MAIEASQPIGVFDSGLGGLTVLKALQEFLPREQFIYFGDTAHLPYGDKSEESLITYVKNIAGFLRNKNCKMMVVACNSATTVLSKAAPIAYESEDIVEVISPIVNLISSQNKYNRIGIIGTRKTIDSGMFDAALKLRNPALQITARPTSLLVPMIEEGFVDERTLWPVFDRYFADFKKVELIIPACTHYPIIYRQIETYFQQKLKVLHTPKIIAEVVREHLQQRELLNKNNPAGKNEYYLSDITNRFLMEAEMYLGRSIDIRKINLRDQN